MNKIVIDVTIAPEYKGKILWAPIACYRFGNLVFLNAYIGNTGSVLAENIIIGTLNNFKPHHIAYAVTGLGTVIRFETNGNMIVDTSAMPVGRNIFQVIYYSNNI